MAGVLGEQGTNLLSSHFSEYTPADALYDEYGVSQLAADKDKHKFINRAKVRPPHTLPFHNHTAHRQYL